MLTPHAITKRANSDGVDAAAVERDYVLAHVVAQLSHASLADGGRLVFKGGTALRFVHMEDYRYSADLDFTILGGTAEDALAALTVVLEAAKTHAGLPHLHLSQGDPPMVEYVGPLGSDRPRKIKVDLAIDEHVAEVVRLPMSAHLVGSSGPRRPFRGVSHRGDRCGEAAVHHPASAMPGSVRPVPIDRRRRRRSSIDPSALRSEVPGEEHRARNVWRSIHGSRRTVPTAVDHGDERAHRRGPTIR